MSTKTEQMVIEKKLATAVGLLSDVLEELQSLHGAMRLSPKVKQKIELGLEELRAGKYTTYKDFKSFERAFNSSAKS